LDGTMCVGERRKELFEVIEESCELDRLHCGK
jgi:hypothetical protein